MLPWLVGAAVIASTVIIVQVAARVAVKAIIIGCTVALLWLARS